MPGERPSNSPQLENVAKSPINVPTSAMACFHQSPTIPYNLNDMRGIEFEVMWRDQDAIEYQVRCSNGSFCGDVKMYSGHDGLPKVAEILTGFPLDAKDSRTVELGTFEPGMAGGGIHMKFYCVDSVGHAAVLAKVRADGCIAMGEAQSVCLCIPVEAGTIDSFVTQARSVGSKVGAKAYLHMADHTVSWVQRWLASTAKSR
jgi:hypothetical protein